MRADSFNWPGPELDNFYNLIGVEATFGTTPQNRKPQMSSSGHFLSISASSDLSVGVHEEGEVVEGREHVVAEIEFVPPGPGGEVPYDVDAHKANLRELC